MKFNIAIAAYVISGILAFGHSASSSSLEKGMATYHATFAAALNPLYWSWVFFEEAQ